MEHTHTIFYRVIFSLFLCSDVLFSDSWSRCSSKRKRMGAPEDGCITRDRLVDNLLFRQGVKQSNDSAEMVYRITCLADCFDTDNSLYVLFLFRSVWRTLADSRHIHTFSSCNSWPVHGNSFLQACKRNPCVRFKHHHPIDSFYVYYFHLSYACITLVQR